MRTKPKKVFWMSPERDLYFSRFVVRANMTHDELNAQLDKQCDMPPLDIPPFAAGYTFMVGNTTVVWIAEFDPTDRQDVAVLSHEIFHATSMRMRAAGCDLCDESEEAFAYYHSYLFRRALTALSGGKTT
jgi:hypothetical protein